MSFEQAGIVVERGSYDPDSLYQLGHFLVGQAALIHKLNSLLDF